MESPCVSCEFRTRSKDICTKAGNYCQKLLQFQIRLDMQDHSIKTTQYNNELSVTLGIKKGVYYYDFN